MVRFIVLFILVSLVGCSRSPIIKCERTREWRVSSTQTVVPRNPSTEVVLVMQLRNAASTLVGSDGKQYEPVCRTVRVGMSAEDDSLAAFIVPEDITKFQLLAEGENSRQFRVDGDVKETLGDQDFQ